MRKIRVGIDPAFRKNGFAMCIIDEVHTAKFKVFKSFLDFCTWAINDRPEDAIWIVENSNLQKACWQKNAMNVGKNQAISQCTVDLLKSFNCEVYEVSPLQKGRVWSDSIFKNAVYIDRNLLIDFKGTEDERCAYQLTTRNIAMMRYER